MFAANKRTKKKNEMAASGDAQARVEGTPRETETLGAVGGTPDPEMPARKDLRSISSEELEKIRIFHEENSGRLSQRKSL